VLFDLGKTKPHEEDFVLDDPPKVVPDPTMPFPFEKLTGAVFDEKRIYRYVLWRVLKEKGGAILWICLNPSTADEDVDDPTVRRIVDYSKRWGYANCVIANLFAFRATDPKAMKAAEDPVGPENMAWLKRLRGQAVTCVAAWGHNGCHRRTGRATLKELLPLGPIHCLGMTKAGHPMHPLYLAKTCKPRLFGRAALAAMFED